MVINSTKIVNKSFLLKCLDNAINKVDMAKLKFREEEGRGSVAELSKTSGEGKN